MDKPHFKYQIFKSICLFVLLISFVPIKAQNVINYGLTVNPSLGQLSSVNNDGFTGLQLKGSFVINFGLCGTYYFDNKTGIYTGIQLNSFDFQMTSREYSVKYNTTDSEGQAYERIISGNSITETSSLKLLQIPVCFLYEKTLSRSIRLFAFAGPAFSFPVMSNINASGTFTYKGYYADGNYTLEDIPMYGFNSDVEVKNKGKMDTRIISISGMATVGCAISLTRYWKISFSANYLRSLTPVLKSNPGKYFPTKEIGSYYSILSREKSALQNISFGISLQKVLLY